MGLFRRSIRPPDPTPNNTDPAGAGAPGTVGPDQLVAPGDPHGVTIEATSSTPPAPPTYILPSGWSGWPAEWGLRWGPFAEQLTDTAWVCVDLNSTVLSTMDPYLVDAASSLDSGWLVNPDPDLYSSWAEFAKQLFWDFQAIGEVFVLTTARYTTGWPARFHVVPPWMVNVWLDRGRRAYEIAGVDVTSDLLHIRYQSSVWDLHGHGPLEAIAGKVAASGVLARYASQLASQGGIPASVLEHPEQLSPTQAAELRAQWVQARIDALGAPAVLSGGVKWTPTQMNPEEMSLQPLADRLNSDIAVALRVPPFLVGLPGGGDSATYKNVTNLFDYHWRAGLRPLESQVTGALSGWLLPRGTSVELNSDAYVQPEPYVRAQTAQIYNAIRDEQGNPVLTVSEIREAERLTDSVIGPTPQSGGPLT